MVRGTYEAQTSLDVWWRIPLKHNLYKQNFFAAWNKM